MVMERGAPGTPTAYIKYKGIWDMEDLYESVIDWFRKRKYKFQEKIYKHKHPSPFGVERQYIWQATRDETEYLRIEYNVYMHTYDAHDVEVVMPNGKPKIFTKGRIWIEIRVTMIFDYAKRFDKNAFYRHIKDFYNKFIIRKRIVQLLHPKYRSEMFALHAFIQHKLKMESDEYEHAHVGGVKRKAGL